jgi:hypothetical protein
MNNNINNIYKYLDIVNICIECIKNGIKGKVDGNKYRIYV